MIDLDLTEERRQLQQTVRKWYARDVLPRIHHLDRQHRELPLCESATGEAAGS